MKIAKKEPLELAPEACIVCHRSAKRMKRGDGWIYLSGVDPVGSMACGKICLSIALARAQETGRVDGIKGTVN